MSDPNDSPSPLDEVRSLTFSGAVLFEASLVLVAAVLSWVFGVPLLGDLSWSGKEFLLGVSSALPLIAFFIWILQSSYPPFVEVRLFLEQFVARMFGRWSIPQLALLSIVAGVGEEILFRGVLQPGMAKITTPAVGLIVASFAFALCHALTKAYFISTFVIGIYLSLVWQAADNLLAPIITHALYDFVALLYFLRWYPRNREEEKED